MKRIINMGKIDYLNCGRKINKVTIEIELKEEEKGKVLSISGNVWNNRETDILMGGQCLDELQGYYKNNLLFKKIYILWKQYHLNDMHAGSKKQEQFLQDNNIENWANNYDKTCDFLCRHNLLYDNGYKFGETWQFWEIPQNDIEEIEKIIKGE